MIGWSGVDDLSRKIPVPWRANWAPIRATTSRELRKQYEAQWSRDEAAAVGDVVEQRLRLVGGDRVDVGVDEQGVVSAERLRVQVLHVLGVSRLDPTLFHHRLDLSEAGRGDDDGPGRRGRGPERAAGPPSRARRLRSSAPRRQERANERLGPVSPRCSSIILPSRPGTDDQRNGLGIGWSFPR